MNSKSEQLPTYNPWLRQRLKEAAVAAPSSIEAASSKLDRLVFRRIVSALKAKKRSPNLSTPRNQLALTLVRRIEKCVRTVLQVNRDGVALKCSQQEARNCLREIEPDVPEEEHPQFLKLLREARDHPISVKNRLRWNRLLTEFVLIIDPKVERFAELKKVRSAKGPQFVKGEKARFRSELLKFFNEALKNLLG